MCITEYNEAETMAMFKEEGRKEGHAEGRAEGHEQGLGEGAEQKLTRQVCRKLRKGKDPAAIAEDLEEDEPHIRKICEALTKFAPEYDEEEVISALWPKTTLGEDSHGNG